MKSNLFNLLVAICTLLSSAADAVEELSKKLATPLSGGDFFSGIMFDVVATHDMELKGIAFHTSATTSIDMSVYTRKGSYEGSELDESEWTLIGTKDIIGLGGGTPTPYPFDSPVMLLEGENRAFYLATTTGPFLRASQTSETGVVAGDEAYSNDDIILKVGVGKKQKIKWSVSFNLSVSTHPVPVSWRIKWGDNMMSQLNPSCSPITMEISRWYMNIGEGCVVPIDG